MISDRESFILRLLKEIPDKNRKAILLQSYVQANGPMSNEAGELAKKILAEDNKHE